MESPAPFDLNQGVADWRRTLSESAAIPRSQLDELEDHVRTSYASLLAQGLPAAEAFHLAVRRVGSPAALAREYLKVNPERLVASHLLRLFGRHKVSLGICTAAGVLAAAAVYLFHPPPFTSEAVFFIRYVMQSGAPGSAEANARTVTPDAGGAAIVNTEVQIVKSLDLAYQVVDALGIDKILAGARGPKDRDHAALVVQSDLSVQPIPQSGVIKLVFSHPNPLVVQPALNAVVETYLRKHLGVHRAADSEADFLAEETGHLRTRLYQTEDELRKVKDKAGVVAVDASKDAAWGEENQIRAQLLGVDSDLTAQNSVIAGETKLLPQVPADEVPGERAHIAQLVVQRDALLARETFLKAKIAEMAEHLAKVGQLEGTLNELQRQKDLDEQNYRYYASRLESMRFDEALGSGHALNIATVEEPTPPQVDWTKTWTLMAGLVASGLGLGLMWMGLSEALMRRLQRPSDEDPPAFGRGGLGNAVPVRAD